ncbi:DUF1846 domain-containing protein [Anaerococcus porci]|uniref:DUF1846 domain-containing protein n=1 Tax=Anaerococcus porci TaxID=2652269 RepID=UPI002A754F77|nr:DUF1846 domain-containing protein [Anaerococcus porci]MDY3006149.1 DUF1846 domain-containing protein [Anaerococcus porci]
MEKKAFNNDKYIEIQSEKIEERIKEFDKLYLEFGGKLFDDAHASRVLPGFQPDSKLQMLKKLKDITEIVIVINANDIESNKIRSDLDIGYDSEVLRLKSAFENLGFFVNSVVITQFDNQPQAIKYAKYLDSLNIKNYKTYDIEGYPNNIPNIISKEGFGKNDYIETQRDLVVVTGPGPGSGKLATCLSQMYLENERGINAGYAKFETFPVWNLPLKHPVNIAYESATADLNDVNMIDPYHLEAYGKTTVNYNRDVEAFPILKQMFERISGSCPYKSPTDMGVNMVGFCIEDEDKTIKASKDEIIRRYYNALVDYKLAKIDFKPVEKIEFLMSGLNLEASDRKVAVRAREKQKQSHVESFAIQLSDGEIVTGKKSTLMSAPAACILNALKKVAGINDDIPLISPHILEPVLKLKEDILKEKDESLSVNDVLIALSISATTNPVTHLAMEKLAYLKNLDVHSTNILDESDKKTLLKMHFNLTQEPVLSQDYINL